jgi:hypothetical protein
VGKKPFHSKFVIEILHIDQDDGKLYENKKNVFFRVIVNYLPLN